jgi:hypothetical protein
MHRNYFAACVKVGILQTHYFLHNYFVVWLTTPMHHIEGYLTCVTVIGDSHRFGFQGVVPPYDARMMTCHCDRRVQLHRALSVSSTYVKHLCPHSRTCNNNFLFNTLQKHIKYCKHYFCYLSPLLAINSEALLKQ